MNLKKIIYVFIVTLLVILTCLFLIFKTNIVREIIPTKTKLDIKIFI